MHGWSGTRANKKQCRYVSSQCKEPSLKQKSAAKKATEHLSQHMQRGTSPTRSLYYKVPRMTQQPQENLTRYLVQARWPMFWSGCEGTSVQGVTSPPVGQHGGVAKATRS